MSAYLKDQSTRGAAMGLIEKGRNKKRGGGGGTLFQVSSAPHRSFVGFDPQAMGYKSSEQPV